MKIMIKSVIKTTLVSIAATLSAYSQSTPNIVFVMCDDLGYGDIQCLNPERGKIPTPGVDRLAKEGMIFTDAHSGASVCTPTRYGLLTGRYSWRTHLQYGVVKGFADNLISVDRPTVASFLQSQGYHTAIIGKWHLNFNYIAPNESEPIPFTHKKALAPVGSTIPDGPITRGFDYFHGFHHAGAMRKVIENDKVILHDQEINMLPRITQKSVEYINARAQDKKPFFLYVPYGSPHAPILPTKEWLGKSGVSRYGDFVMETDDGFRQILDALDRNGLTENTLVIFTSDNGCSKSANFASLEAKGHYASAHLRGSKSDLWDGGHRVPFIVRWPKVIAAGSKSDQILCLTDLFATTTDILGLDTPANSAEDSVSFLPALKGEKIVSSRKGIIHHSVSGHFSYREEDWKLLLAYGSGGWSNPKEEPAKKEKSIHAQLYNMAEDVGETKNLYKKEPEVAARLLKQLEDYVTSGRSTDGPVSTNDIPNEDIVLWKSEDEVEK